VIGTSVRLSGLNYTIVGVMPSTFRFPDKVEIWAPMQFTPEDLASPGNHVVWAIARLKPGVTFQQAQAEMDLIMPRLQTVWTASVIPLTDHYVGDIRLALYVLLAAAGLVLLIACVNVAGLLVARGSSRQREFAMRAAIGASRARILQQLLTETTLVALIGGALGILLTLFGIAMLKTLLISSVPRLEDVTVSSAIIVFSVFVSIITGILFGLAPAWRLSRGNLNDSLKAGGRMSASGSQTRLRSALVVCEVALAVLLLAGAGILLKSLSKLLEVRTGVNAEHVLTASINLPTVDYREPHEQVRFVGSLLQRLQTAPDVLAVAASTGLPFAGVEDSGIHFDGRTEGPLTGTAANHYRVTPGYFRAMQIPLVRGRLFTDDDTAAGPPVVLINETMARRFFPDEDPIGKRLEISGPTYTREIVGVVGDVKQEDLRRATAPQVYEAFAQKPRTGFSIVLRSAGDPKHLVETLRQGVNAIDRNQPLSDVMTMEDVIGDTMMRDRMSAGLLGLFALLALVLAAIGIYGVIAYSVAQRTQEIGVRLALGADRAHILRLILGQTMRLVLFGLTLGLIASVGVSRLLESLLYEVSPRDPLTLLSISVLLVSVALAAGLVPAMRALRVHPIVALRAE
jgi:putative ABC transport system permease protein